MYPKTKEITYLYDDVEPSLDDDILYHFTTADSFFKILESMSLKSSDFSRLNDLNEGNLRNGNMPNACLDISVGKALCEKGTLLCFTKNFEQEEHNSKMICTGINHPRMWAQYADNNNGVCIALKKEQFLEDNKNLLKDKFYKLENVDYHLVLSLKFDNCCMGADDFIEKNWRELLYLKQDDWKQEKEVRFFALNLESKFLSIENSVAFICLSYGFLHKEENMRKLISYMITPTSISYKKLVPRSFAECVVDGLGYHPEDCASIILGRLLSYLQKYSAYTKWLHDEFNYSVPLKYL